MEIFEEAFDQYGTSNSGFDGNLRDLMIDLCSTPEEKCYERDQWSNELNSIKSRSLHWKKQ